MESIVKKQKIKNPLRKRIGRELTGEWTKYLVVSLFLILTIGFVSGMYVANGSMLAAAGEGKEKYKLESGHFELKEKADADLLAGIATGEKADMKQYFTDKAKKELDEKFAEAFPEAYKDAYKEAYDEAYAEAWEEIVKEIDEKYADAEEEYDLNNPDFKPVKVSVYEHFFRNAEEDNDNDGKGDGTIRVYTSNDEVDLACLMEGSFPEKEDEIAIDRMHADNNDIRVGDEITVDGVRFKVTGLLAYVNYSTLHEKATDLIFDALKFDVGMVTEEGFARLASSVHYDYAWKYENMPADEIEEKKLSDNFMRALLTQVVTADNEIKDYMPSYSNPAVNFATEDMGSDETMGGVILDVLIVIIAFIFAITISNTIVKESSAIGTLRASGYTKGELVRHYIATPVVVTLFSAVVGNVLGYTVFKDFVVSMYYNSYSLPSYETVWNGGAFYKTTLIPIALMFIVNLVVIVGMMKHTPLQFLRHNLKRSKRKKALRLPKWKFFNRFRVRIMLQNAANYLVLFVGILFIALMLAMAVGMPGILSYYQENAPSLMFAQNQYVLTSYKDEDGNVIETDNPDAEKFCMTSLLKRTDTIDEEISVYGVEEGSRYIELPALESLKEGEVYVSEPYADKYRLNVGDTIELAEKYENKQYSFRVAGIYDHCQSLAVFLSNEAFRQIFDLKAEEFTGFMSDSRITDIAEKQIATVITVRDITKMCDQLDHSMGAYMEYFQVLCILLSAVMIYLLTKIIIEKNEKAISMTKILGYRNGEIAALYLLSTTIIVVVEDLLSVFIGAKLMAVVWRVMMMSYSGWFAFTMQPVSYGKMFCFILIGYLLVMGLDFCRIKKIPMDQALKNVE